MTIAPCGNIIWQYWETRGEKPRFVDGLREIAKKNSGVKTILVTPETLREYLPDIEDDIFAIEDLAHKADMIRTRLVMRYGGMWLDSDAVVLRDLNFLFDHLKEHEFVGFNNGGRLQAERPWVRVCCFLSRPNGTIISQWVNAQREKLPRTRFAWPEIGAHMLNGVCMQNSSQAKILPFEKICPVPGKKVALFVERDDALATRIIEDCFIVMMTNRALHERKIPVTQLSVEEIAIGDHLLAKIMQRALGRAEDDGAIVEVDTVHGRIAAFENDFITAQIRKFGAHTRPDIAMLRSVVHPGDFVFDLGAHIGTYAIPLAQKTGAAGRLLAVEGRRENFELLKRNLSGLDAETEALNALVAQSGGRYAVHAPDGNTGGTYFLPDTESGVAMEAVSIDDLCARYFTPRVIKLDIEGGEFAALSGSDAVRRERPILYCEINAKVLHLQGASIADMDALLSGQGYRLFRNIGPRHSASDAFRIGALDSLPTYLNNFDVLAIHSDDDRLAEVSRAAQTAN